MASYSHVLFFSLIGGVFSLAGGIILLNKKRTATVLANYAAPFAAGALLGAAFFDLLPEAIEIMAEGSASRWALIGIITFFLLEHFLHWFHHHHEHEDKTIKTAVPLIVIGDSVHNFLDGIAIGAAFLINIPTGIVAAIAVAAHEIPQEIGDFGLLLKAGVSPKNVIRINIASALMSTVGALVTFWLGTQTSLPLGALIALTAGFFIYIAASDLIPTIHQRTSGRLTHLSAALLVFGVLVVGVTTEIAHKYIDAGDAKTEIGCIDYFDKEGHKKIYQSCNSNKEEHHSH